MTRQQDAAFDPGFIAPRQTQGIRVTFVARPRIRSHSSMGTGWPKWCSWSVREAASAIGARIGRGTCRSAPRPTSMARRFLSNDWTKSTMKPRRRRSDERSYA
jgi:hypothetical protein